MKPLSPNVLIQNRYLIVHLIGKGGMGEVYLAVDQRLGSAVALKRTFFSDDESLATAFEREARILANLRHPILPKVSDHFVDGENQFLVMEHITGDDLAKRLEKTQKAFPLSWVLFWADQLLDALHYLHKHDPPIIHRDIKPQNLKLTNDNHIVLLDFGLSKNSIGETRTSTGGSVVGYTPHYAPMEQIRGTGTNAQSDLYSLSATIYQLITNIVPPDALTRADSLLSGLPDPIRPINEFNKEVTDDVSAVILKGMDVRQDNRFGDAREMQKKLRDAYSRLQSAMNAQTVAFNVDEKEIEAAKTALETEIPSEPLPFVKSDSDELVFAAAPGDPVITEPTNDQESAAPIEAADAATDVKPSEVKTEVLLAGDFPAIQAARESSEISFTEDLGFESESVSDVEGFKTSDDLGVDVEFGADGSFDAEDDVFEGVGGNGETEFFAGIVVEEEQGSGSTFSAETGTGKAGDRHSLPNVESRQPLKKSSAGKKFAIAVGLFALLFVLVGAIGGAGWVMYKGGWFAAEATPSPTPEATVEITPSVEPTIDLTLIDSNSNVAENNSNANTNVQIGGGNVNRKPDVTVTQPTAMPQTTVRPVTTPPPVVKATPRPTEAPKKTPTGILQ